MGRAAAELTNIGGGRLKVFLSWSGDRSQKLADELKEWLPLVLYYVEPWVSKSDIEAGERWANEVGKELDASNFGVICITAENVESPWILFESGALSKSMQEGRVVPMLLDLEFKDITGPLAQFQSKKVDQGGIWDLVSAINNLAQSPVPEARLKQLFGKLLPDLSGAISNIPKAAARGKVARPQHEVLEELVTSVRGLDSRLREVTEEGAPRRRLRRYGPDMMMQVIHSMRLEPRDATRFLVFGSYFKDEAPWLYELAMEAYRTALRGGRKEALDAERRLARALDNAMHGPLGEMLGSRDLRHIMMEGRELLSLSSREVPDDPPATNQNDGRPDTE